eukprot:SAG31_NODE_1957_length_6817_cov_5.488389_8_plen_77_part_00
MRENPPFSIYLQEVSNESWRAKGIANDAQANSRAFFFFFFFFPNGTWMCTHMYYYIINSKFRTRALQLYSEDQNLR